MAEPIGLFGGTFDPVHYGHLRLADELQRALDVADLRLVPAGTPPHRGAPRATAAQRVAMLELARAEFPRLAIDTREVDRATRSYTVLTLESLRAAAPARPLWWIVGADAFLGLPSWHRWRALFGLAHLVVVGRPGVELESALPPELAPEWHARLANGREALRTAPAGAIYRQDVTPQPISASAIRAMLGHGPAGAAAARGLLPDAVLTYIVRNGLYGASTPLQDAT
ncbi:MAG: nicotinate-nucleotide adenylyltransferase [Casimicrobiaceae bacterium]